MWMVFIGKEEVHTWLWKDLERFGKAGKEESFQYVGNVYLGDFELFLILLDID